jgi:alkylation response protein AidB-like acyl-CoA dehydrogenase
MLDLAVAHTRDRRQFGQVLGSFQAVQHKLADVRVWLEAADLGAESAWEDIDQFSAALAKIHAGRAARTAARNCQQVLGGMGFTWEQPFHRYLRRAWTLEPLLGTAEALRGEIGAALRERGSLPLLAQL